MDQPKEEKFNKFGSKNLNWFKRPSDCTRQESFNLQAQKVNAVAINPGCILEPH
jgi:hypothetical protein